MSPVAVPSCPPPLSTTPPSLSTALGAGQKGNKGERYNWKRLFQEMPKRCRFSSESDVVLPSEIQEEIFGFLRRSFNATVVSRVCHRWRRTLQNASRWWPTWDGGRYSAKHLKALLGSYPKLKIKNWSVRDLETFKCCLSHPVSSLTFRGGGLFFIDQTSLDLATHLPLTQFEFCRVGNRNVEFLNQVLPKLKNLSHVSLTSSEGLLEEIPLSIPLKSISCCAEADVLQCFTSSMSWLSFPLETLRFRKLPEGLSIASLSKLPLTCLKIQMLGTEETSQLQLLSLREFPQLTSLSLGFIDPKTFNTISLPHLSTLQLCSQRVPTIDEKTETLRLGNVCPNLQHLDIGRTYRIDFGGKIKALQTLKLKVNFLDKALPQNLVLSPSIKVKCLFVDLPFPFEIFDFLATCSPQQLILGRRMEGWGEKKKKKAEKNNEESKETKTDKHKFDSIQFVAIQADVFGISKSWLDMFPNLARLTLHQPYLVDWQPLLQHPSLVVVEVPNYCLSAAVRDELEKTRPNFVANLS